MKIENLETRLKTILGGTYGGPSISYEKETEEFVIYRWFDAPVGDEILGRGKTLHKALLEAEKSPETKKMLDERAAWEAQMEAKQAWRKKMHLI